MNKSDDIGELGKALSKFQGEVKDPVKDQKAYNYKYADLSNILEISRPLLSKNGLSVVQLTNIPDGKVCLETVLIHESGQWISSSTEMNVPEFKGLTQPQCVGIVITYARRYALSAILGIAQTDSDASEQVVEKNLRSNVTPKASTDQIKELLHLIKEDKETIAKILIWANIKDINDITQEYCLKAIESRKQKEVSEKNLNNDTIKLIDENLLKDLELLINNDDVLKNNILKQYNVDHLSKINETQYICIRDELRIMSAKIEVKPESISKVA